LIVVASSSRPQTYHFQIEERELGMESVRHCRSGHTELLPEVGDLLNTALSTTKEVDMANKKHIHEEIDGFCFLRAEQ